MHTHTAQKEIAHECVCVYLRSMHASAHKNIRSPAPHLYTHQRHVRTSTKTTKHRHQHKKIRSSAPHSHTRTNTQKKNVHIKIPNPDPDPNPNPNPHRNLSTKKTSRRQRRRRVCVHSLTLPSLTHSLTPPHSVSCVISFCAVHGA